MTYKEIVEKVRGTGLAPDELGRAKEFLSGEYAFVAARLEEVLKSKQSVWDRIRNSEGVKSDTQAERKYGMTEDGRDEIIYRLRLKAIEKLMSSISSRLRILEGEARNQF